MKLEGFKEFYFFGTLDQVSVLIELHKLNGCEPYNKETKDFSAVCFNRNMSVGVMYLPKTTARKSYTEAKAYLLSFAKPAMPAKVAKPKRKKSVAFNQGFVIDGARYTKTHILGKKIERLEAENKHTDELNLLLRTNITAYNALGFWERIAFAMRGDEIGAGQ